CRRREDRRLLQRPNLLSCRSEYLLRCWSWVQLHFHWQLCLPVEISRAERVRVVSCSRTIAGILSSRRSRLRNFLERLTNSRFLCGMHRKIAQRYDTDQVFFAI